MSTTPDSISYPIQNYGVLGPLPAYVINIQDVPGADPTGNDDSTLAINTALASLPDDGGELIIAPGIYKFSGALRAKSNTVISGTGTLRAAPRADWVPNGEYWGITNVNNDATEITDENITVRDITIDYTDFLSAEVGTRWAIYWRMARNVRNINVKTYNATNHVAHRACERVASIDAYGIGFTNCGLDHWEQTNDVVITGGYLETGATNQMVNFNPELDSGSTGYTCTRFTMAGLVMNFTGANPTAVQIEPLYDAGSSVSDVTVTGCVFGGTRLIMRGATTNATISGNSFRAGGTGEVISVYGQLGGSPSGFTITGNSIFGAETSGGSGGVIRIETDEATVTGNYIEGTAYTGVAIYRNTFKPNILANRVETAPIPGTLQAGFRIINGSDNYIGIEDNQGSTGLRVYVQNSDNNLVFNSTDASGDLRAFMTLTARSDTSNLVFAIPSVFASTMRIIPQTGITAAGSTSGTATLLTSNFCEVTTVAASTGVRLPQPGAQSVTGTRVVVWNAGANTLNVYPMSGGQIDALGTDTADTIAAGASKTYVALSATLYRIET